jgi:hypothetical protein
MLKLSLIDDASDAEFVRKISLENIVNHFIFWKTILTFQNQEFIFEICRIRIFAFSGL